MKKSGKKTVQAGTMFQKAAIAVVVAGATGMFALGAMTQKNKAAPEATDQATNENATAVSALLTVKAEAQSPIVVKISSTLEGASGAEQGTLAKPFEVTMAGSTGKLWELFREIGYEIDGVRIHGEVPRLFLASLPGDLRHLPRVELRKTTFIKSTLPLILHVNELILQDRQRLKQLRGQAVDGKPISDHDTEWLEVMADFYDTKSADPAALLKSVDIIPPSLAIAQAAEESGWGTSRFAREGNALFGQRAYKAHKKGIVPKKRAEGTSFRVRAFDHLIDGVKSYAHNLNSHSAYKEFRDARAQMRAQDGEIGGYRLAGALMRYSERGADYIGTIRLIMRANKLSVFDAARLGSSIAPDA